LARQETLNPHIPRLRSAARAPRVTQRNNRATSTSRAGLSVPQAGGDVYLPYGYDSIRTAGLRMIDAGCPGRPLEFTSREMGIVADA